MMTSIHFWLRCSLWAVFGLAMLSVISIVAKERLRERLENGRLGNRWGRSMLVITGERVTKQAAKIVALAFGVLIGYGIRDLYQFHHTYVLNDLHVVRRDAPDRYLLAFHDTHDTFEVKFCPDYTPDFARGMTLKTLVYEDRGSCWSISNHKLGYKLARNDRGEVIRTEGALP